MKRNEEQMRRDCSCHPPSVLGARRRVHEVWH
jgi:hypothetical protein